MALILLGLLLWTWPHLMKEYTPGLRAGLSDGTAKGVVALSALLAIVLMVLGYRMADVIYVYAPPSWGQHLNNLLMLISVALFGAAKGTSHLRAWVRHPMFLGAILWGISHLLVRGDAASILLFGGIILWAVAGWITTNRRTPAPAPIVPSFKKDVILIVATLVAFAAIVFIHGLVGPSPLPM